jgi:DNA-binding MarR family transcriptional regulator
MDLAFVETVAPSPVRNGVLVVPPTRDGNVGLLLRLVSQRASAVLSEMVAAADLTPPQYAVLTRLKDFGEVSQNRLGRMVGMDPATIQGVIRRLAARNLLAIRPDPADRRRVLLQVSGPGARLLQRLGPVAERVNERLLAGLDRHERETLVRLLRNLTD